MKIRDLAKGRWPEIFQKLDIPVGEGKHGPCPLCGGKDRFRVSDYHGNGDWICNQCGHGDGFDMVMKYRSVNFRQAVDVINLVLGESRPFTPAKKKDPTPALNNLWLASIPLTGGDPVDKYLKKRGLKVPIRDVRYCPGCYESDTKRKYQAMIAMVRDRDGVPVTLHRTYLGDGRKADIESPKKLMTAKATLRGCAVRLTEVGQTLGIAEGIETAMAAMQLFEIPCWAAVSSTLLAGWLPPAGVESVVIFGDNDGNFTGQKAAYVLANKLFLDGYRVRVEIPKQVGDWADAVKADGTKTIPD